MLLVIALGALFVAQPRGAEARPLTTGFTFVESYEPVALQHVKEAGARFVRIIAYWPQIAPKTMPEAWQPEDPTDPAYDWSSTDLAVTRTVEAGLTPVLMIHDAPLWAQGCTAPAEVRGESLKGALCEPNPGMLAAFTKAAVRRYDGDFGGLPRVRYWQGLNEPNLSLFFNPQFRHGRPVSPTLYRRLINAFYAAVKSVSPSNLVLMAGLGPIAVPGLTTGPLRFTRELLCMRGRHDPQPLPGNCHGGVRFDIFDIHPYTTGGPTHKGHADDVELGDLGELRELIAAADRAGRIKGRFRHTPLWMTEISWDSKPPDPGGVPMGILTRWTAEALYRAWDAGVSHLFWLALRDNAPNPKVPFSQSIEAGLYFRGTTVAEDTPKPNMYAFRFPCVAYSRPSGFFFWGRTPTSRRGKVVIQVRQGGGWRNATAVRADKNGIFDGIAKGTYGRHKHGWVRALYRGERAVPFSLHPVKDFYQPPFG